MALYQVLEDTDGMSTPHRASGNLLYATVEVSPHNGGTWTLEFEDPDGTWVSTGVTFTEAGIRSDLGFAAGVRYRLNGGDVGAKGYIEEFA